MNVMHESVMDAKLIKIQRKKRQKVTINIFYPSHLLYVRGKRYRGDMIPTDYSSAAAGAGVSA
jgi:hypothetical protein